MDNNYGELVIVPEVGMPFKLEDDVYGMYNSYARSIDFSIRKSMTRQRPDKTIRSTLFIGTKDNEVNIHHTIP
jgi:hypothetical protein